ncbi:MAG: hypothetical protein AAFY07_10280, partial [Pseudomonadota bacterium]
MTKVARKAAWLMASAGILALSACGGDDAPPGNISGPVPTPSPSPSPSPSPTPPPSGSDPVVTNDIQYGEGATLSGNIPLFLDLYAPDEPCNANRPTVVFVHGGGFVSGNKRSGSVTTIAEEMVARSINV